jgi:hypothetical protein
MKKTYAVERTTGARDVRVAGENGLTFRALFKSEQKKARLSELIVWSRFAEFFGPMGAYRPQPRISWCFPWFDSEIFYIGLAG